VIAEPDDAAFTDVAGRDHGMPGGGGDQHRRSGHGAVEVVLEVVEGEGFDGNGLRDVVIGHAAPRRGFGLSRLELGIGMARWCNGLLGLERRQFAGERPDPYEAAPLAHTPRERFPRPRRQRVPAVAGLQQDDVEGLVAGQLLFEVTVEQAEVALVGARAVVAAQRHGPFVDVETGVDADRGEIERKALGELDQGAALGDAWHGENADRAAAQRLGPVPVGRLDLQGVGRFEALAAAAAGSHADVLRVEDGGEEQESSQNAFHIGHLNHQRGSGVNPAGGRGVGGLTLRVWSRVGVIDLGPARGLPPAALFSLFGGQRPAGLGLVRLVLRAGWVVEVSPTALLEFGLVFSRICNCRPAWGGRSAAESW
jgi:hypothetical protein